MVLIGTTPASGGQLGRVPTKLTLFHVSADTVRQFAQTSSDSGKTWTTSYVLLYVRAESARVPAVSAQVPTDAQLASRVDEYMGRLSALGYTGGVLVVRDGKPLFTRSYGMANREVGIKADTFNADYSPTDYEPTTRDEYVRRMFAAPLRSRPGAAFFYANSGYSLLAAIVQIVTKQDYEVALRELVLRPAGMLQTGYTLPAWNATRIAHGYQEGRDWGTIAQRIAVPGGPYWELRGNGGLRTTLGDMARWDAALNDKRMMTDSSRRKFMTGYVNEGPAGLSHNGGNGVYVAQLLRFVDDHVTVFVTSTVSDLTATSAVRVLSKIVFGEPYELPPARVAVSAQAVSTACHGRHRVAGSVQAIEHALACHR